MAASPKIVLSRSQDISFNKLSLSQANVRRAKAGVSIEAMAESIVRHSLLQSLTVPPGARIRRARRPACSRCRSVAGASARWNCWWRRSG